MIRIQKKIHQGLELLQFFTVREWNFANDKFLALWDEVLLQNPLSTPNRIKFLPDG